MFDIKSLLRKHAALDFSTDEIAASDQKVVTSTLFSLDDDTWSKLPFELQCFAHDVNACLEDEMDTLVNIAEYEPQLVLDISDLESLSKDDGYVFEVSFKSDPPTDPVQGILVEASADKGFLILEAESRQLELQSKFIDEIVLIAKEKVEVQAKKEEPAKADESEKKKPEKKASKAKKDDAIKPPRKSALSEMKIYMLKKGLSSTKEEVREHLKSKDFKLSDSTFDLCFNDMRSTLKIIEWLAKGDV